MISIIAAVAENGAIGLNGDLIYHISADLKRFKALTTGNTIVMGRKTFDSLPKGALPNRRNIVLSRQQGLELPGAEVFPSLDMALASCAPDEKVYIIGGAQIYAHALPLADELEITLVHDAPVTYDACFPDWRSDKSWILTARQDFELDSNTPFAYSFLTFCRKR